MARTKKVAFLYEGVSAEDKLLHNLQKVYFAEECEIEIFSFPADGNIYMLYLVWQKLLEDDFDTNVIDILKEMSKETRNRLEAEGLKASDFSEIYMFFDYDGHACSFSDEKLKKANDFCLSMGMGEIKNFRDILERMLQVFDNETENGKLYVSYPMIESIKEIDEKEMRYKQLHIPLCEIDKYKSSFTEKSAYEDYNKLDKALWDIACKASVGRASLIVRDTEECTYDEFINDITQIEIYHAQKEKYINNKTIKSLAILNSVPLFVVEYFDEVLF